MHDFTPDQSRRWHAWQSANLATDLRSTRIMQVFWSGVLAVIVLVLAVLLATA